MKKEFRNAAGEIERFDEAQESFYGYKNFKKIRQGQRWGVVNKDYDEILPCRYDSVEVWPQGCIVIEQNGKFGIANENGEPLVPCIYDEIDGEFSGEYLRVESDGKWGLVYKDGKEALPCKYDDVDTFYGDYAPVQINGEWGVVNEEDVEVFPCEYGNVTIKDVSEEGYTEFELDGKTVRRYDNGEVYWN